MITFFAYFLLLIIKASATAYPEHILLNCGSNSASKSSDGQTWDGDVGTKLSPDIHKTNISFPATVTEQDPSINSSVPYLTARIIHSKFSYIFPLSSGRKILRLYFYLATYSITINTYITQSVNTNHSVFAVTVNQYALLNSSTYLTISSQKPQAPYLVKEFIINVQQTQALNVTFMPMPNSYAFINGMEVVSIPAHVYMGSYYMNTPRGLRESANVPRDMIKIDQDKTALEALYRINVGGGRVDGKDDSAHYYSTITITGYNNLSSLLHPLYILLKFPVLLHLVPFR